MDLSTDRLEGSARIQDRAFTKSPEEPERRAIRRPKTGAEPETEPADEQENHQLDDIA